MGTKNRKKSILAHHCNRIYTRCNQTQPRSTKSLRAKLTQHNTDPPPFIPSQPNPPSAAEPTPTAKAATTETTAAKQPQQADAAAEAKPKEAPPAAPAAAAKEKPASPTTNDGEFVSLTLLEIMLSGHSGLSTTVLLPCASLVRDSSGQTLAFDD